jgi:hypothetical protein
MWKRVVRLAKSRVTIIEKKIMKIGTRITGKKILEALPCIEKDHGDNAMRVAKLIKQFCQNLEPEDFYNLLVANEDLLPKVPYWHDFDSFYHPRFWYDTALKYIDLLLQTHGVEGISTEDYSCYKCVAQYCNAGDAYATTVYWDDIKKEFHIGCWGDLVEHYEHTKGWTF